MKFATFLLLANISCSEAARLQSKEASGSHANEAARLQSKVASKSHANDDTCPDLETSVPFKSTSDGQVIENLYIFAEPTDDTALWIKHDDVTVRNVVIHHAANSRGLFFFNANGLTVENVEVIAYGVHGTTDENNWGAQPCPLRKPFSGYNCANVMGYKSENLTFKNVRTDGGSKGISINQCPGAHMDHVIAKNVRGPFPAGQCFQLGNESTGAILENFYCLNEPGKHWSEDTVSAWRASDVTIRNGVIDGGNGLTGMGVMFENSATEAVNGLLENVEVRNAQGCFSAFPGNGVVMRNNTCGPQNCAGTPERGRKPRWINSWTFGNNGVHGVYGQNNIIEDSFYTPLCDIDEASGFGQRAYWHATAMTENPVVTVTNLQELPLEDYVPKEPITIEFPWDGCMEVPDISCTDFPSQELNGVVVQTNPNTNEPQWVVSEGMCIPNEGNPVHPNEETE